MRFIKVQYKITQRSLHSQMNDEWDDDDLNKACITNTSIFIRFIKVPHIFHKGHCTLKVTALTLCMHHLKKMLEFHTHDIFGFPINSICLLYPTPKFIFVLAAFPPETNFYLLDWHLQNPIPPFCPIQNSISYLTHTLTPSRVTQNNSLPKLAIWLTTHQPSTNDWQSAITCPNIMFCITIYNH
jgi:hypothetical protein